MTRKIVGEGNDQIYQDNYKLTYLEHNIDSAKYQNISVNNLLKTFNQDLQICENRHSLDWPRSINASFGQIEIQRSPF